MENLELINQANRHQFIAQVHIKMRQFSLHRKQKYLKSKKKIGSKQLTDVKNVWLIFEKTCNEPAFLSCKNSRIYWKGIVKVRLNESTKSIVDYIGRLLQVKVRNVSRRQKIYVINTRLQLSVQSMWHLGYGRQQLWAVQAQSVDHTDSLRTTKSPLVLGNCVVGSKANPFLYL